MENLSQRDGTCMLRCLSLQNQQSPASPSACCSLLCSKAAQQAAMGVLDIA